MKNFEQLIFDGKDYEIKKHLGFEVFIIGLWVLVALALVLFTTYLKTGIGILALFLLGFILSKTTHKKSRKIVMKDGKPEAFAFYYTTFNKPLIFPFKDIQSFDLRKNYYARILINGNRAKWKIKKYTNF